MELPEGIQLCKDMKGVKQYIDSDEQAIAVYFCYCTELKFNSSDNIYQILDTCTKNLEGMELGETLEGNSKADLDEITHVQTAITGKTYYGLLRVRIFWNEEGAIPHDSHYVNSVWFVDQNSRDEYCSILASNSGQ